MTSDQAADPEAPQWFDRRWLALAVIAVAPLMTALDATIVNIALPSAHRSLAFGDKARARLSSPGAVFTSDVNGFVNARQSPVFGGPFFGKVSPVADEERPRRHTATAAVPVGCPEENEKPFSTVPCAVVAL
jgi:hypothetical protein